MHFTFSLSGFPMPAAAADGWRHPHRRAVRHAGSAGGRFVSALLLLSPLVRLRAPPAAGPLALLLRPLLLRPRS